MHATKFPLLSVGEVGLLAAQLPFGAVDVQYDERCRQGGSVRIGPAPQIFPYHSYETLLAPVWRGSGRPAAPSAGRSPYGQRRACRDERITERWNMPRRGIWSARPGATAWPGSTSSPSSSFTGIPPISAKWSDSGAETRRPDGRARPPGPHFIPWVGPHPAHRRIPVAKAPIANLGYDSAPYRNRPEMAC